MKSLSASLLAGLAMALSASASLAGELTVYTAMEADMLDRYLTTFNSHNRTSRSTSCAIGPASLPRSSCEEANPQADVVGAWPRPRCCCSRPRACWKPTSRPALARSTPPLTDQDRPPSWVGMDAWAASSASTRSKPEARPADAASWKDLTNPSTGPDRDAEPGLVGHRLPDVSSWLQLFGEDGRRWEYMDALHENVAAYTHSGSKPCNMAAAGEYADRHLLRVRAAKSKAEGAPIELIVPNEGLGWDLEASASQGHRQARGRPDAGGLADHRGSDGDLQQGYAVLRCPAWPAGGELPADLGASSSRTTSSGPPPTATAS